LHVRRLGASCVVEALRKASTGGFPVGPLASMGTRTGGRAQGGERETRHGEAEPGLEGDAGCSKGDH
jgi:hypothetical protein